MIIHQINNRTCEKEKESNMSLCTNELRVIMILFVIFVHENLNKDRDGYFGLVIANTVNIAVPIFFFISGYYFFHGKELTLTLYKEKLIRRFHTLLIPYILWNLVPFFNIIGGNLFSILFRGKSFEALHTYLSDIWDIGIWRIWWNITAGTMPYDSPLWYVRDLMFMCILSPIIYIFAVTTKFVGWWIVIILWFVLPDTQVPGLSRTAIVFFSLGAFSNILHLYPADIFGKYSLVGFLVTICALIMTILLPPPCNRFCFSLYILLGVFSSYWVVSMIPSQISQMFAVFSGSVFFIYAFHNTCVLSFVSKIVSKTFIPHEFAILLVPLLTFICCYSLWVFFTRICPRLMSLLCGGRIGNRV